MKTKSTIKLCCIFNYPPLYRQSIYKKIDETFDTQFYFGREVEKGKNSGIKKLDFTIFKKHPLEFDNVVLFHRFLWRSKIVFLPLSRKYTHFLLTGDLCWSYIPFFFFCKLMRKKVYAWGHGRKKKTKIWSIARYLYNNVDKFFVYGERGKQRLVELGVPQNKLTVIYNSLNEGVNPDAQQAFKSDIYEQHFSNCNPVLIFVGRLTPVKRLDWLIRIVYEQKLSGHPYNLVIVGNGEEYNALKEYVRHSNIDDLVWFYGECYDSNILSGLLYNADLCISPGNVGLTAMRAMEYGVPVISHDNFEKQMPEYEAIIEGKTGALYKFEDFDDLKYQINNWFDKMHDRDVIRKNCYDVINNHFNSNYQIKILHETIK